MVRVITPGMTERQILERVLKALSDPEVESIVVHKPGSWLSWDGREVMVGAHGELVPRYPEAVQTC